MSFPREENLDDLVRDGEYVEAARWRVFEDLTEGTGRLPGRQVLLVLGDRWTIISSDTFHRMAARILPQL